MNKLFLKLVFLLAGIFILARKAGIPDWDWWRNLADVVQGFGVGIGSVLGGMGAVTVINDWVKERGRRRGRKRWQNLISPSRLKNKEIDLIRNGDEVYAVDKTAEPNTMWWIRNPSTLHDLGFRGKQAREVDQEELEKYDEKGQINFYEI